MNKKLVKVQRARMDTLEAMSSGCPCDCTNCSGGGSFTAEESRKKQVRYHNNGKKL